jgi:signal transduction histidine kinase
VPQRALQIFDEKSRDLRVAAVGPGRALPAGVATPALARGSPDRRALSLRRPVIVEDVAEHPGIALYWPGSRSLLAVPLTSRGKSFGVLRLEYGDPDAFDEEDVAILGILAEQIGLAIGRARIVRALHRRQADLSAVSADLERVLEEDRRRIARELHDELAQSMTAAKINLGLLRGMAGEGQAPMRRVIADTSALIDRTISETRRISMDLRPSMLDELGLLPTLHWYASTFASGPGSGAGSTRATGAPESETPRPSSTARQEG